MIQTSVFDRTAQYIICTSSFSNRKMLLESQIYDTNDRVGLPHRQQYSSNASEGFEQRYPENVSRSLQVETRCSNFPDEQCAISLYDRERSNSHTTPQNQYTRESNHYHLQGQSKVTMDSCNNTQQMFVKPSSPRSDHSQFIVHQTPKHMMTHELGRKVSDINEKHSFHNENEEKSSSGSNESQEKELVNGALLALVSLASSSGPSSQPTKCDAKASFDKCSAQSLNGDRDHTLTPPVNSICDHNNNITPSSSTASLLVSYQRLNIESSRNNTECLRKVSVDSNARIDYKHIEVEPSSHSTRHDQNENPTDYHNRIQTMPQKHPMSLPNNSLPPMHESKKHGGAFPFPSRHRIPMPRLDNKRRSPHTAYTLTMKRAESNHHDPIGESSYQQASYYGAECRSRNEAVLQRNVNSRQYDLPLERMRSDENLHSFPQAMKKSPQQLHYEPGNERFKRGYHSQGRGIFEEDVRNNFMNERMIRPDIPREGVIRAASRDDYEETSRQFQYQRENEMEGRGIFEEDVRNNFMNERMIRPDIPREGVIRAASRDEYEETSRQFQYQRENEMGRLHGNDTHFRYSPSDLVFPSRPRQNSGSSFPPSSRNGPVRLYPQHNTIRPGPPFECLDRAEYRKSLIVNGDSRFSPHPPHLAPYHGNHGPSRYHSQEHLSDEMATKKTTILRRKCAWKNYPELEQFLIENREEYLLHSAKNYTIEQKQYNNRLTERLLEVATKHNYAFDPNDFNFVAIRDRIRCYYKSYVQSNKKRGVIVGYDAAGTKKRQKVEETLNGDNILEGGKQKDVTFETTTSTKEEDNETVTSERTIEKASE